MEIAIDVLDVFCDEAILGILVEGAATSDPRLQQIILGRAIVV
jgi:hypothetical protein